MGGESDEIYSKLDKQLSDFVKKSPVNISECQSVIKSSQMDKNADQTDKQCNRNTRIATVANSCLTIKGWL